MTRSAVLAVIFCAFPGTSPITAASASSDTYSFEYSTTVISSGKSRSGSYELVGRVDEVTAQLISTSSNYSIEPLVGSSGDNASAVVDWAIYW